MWFRSKPTEKKTPWVEQFEKGMKKVEKNQEILKRVPGVIDALRAEVNTINREYCQAFENAKNELIQYGYPVDVTYGDFHLDDEYFVIRRDVTLVLDIETFLMIPLAEIKGVDFITVELTLTYLHDADSGVFKALKFEGETFYVCDMTDSSDLDNIVGILVKGLGVLAAQLQMKNNSDPME